jgi:hypothetical protein
MSNATNTAIANATPVMNIGDKVLTTDGPGTVTHVWEYKGVQGLKSLSKVHLSRGPIVRGL